MKLEDQVCSLELSKKLRELDVKQESLCWWINLHGKVIVTEGLSEELCNPYTMEGVIASAFTVAELGEMLPGGYLKEARYEDGYYIAFLNTDMSGYGVHPKMHDKTEANVRAKMLIWLIENGKVKT